MSLTHSTKQLLASIMSRSDARLQAAAVGARAASVSPAEFEELDVPKQLVPFKLSTEEIWGAFTRQTRVLATDAWELTWSEITEELLDNQEMDCTGLGQFSFDPDRGVVRFKADEPLQELTPITVMGEETVWSVAMVAGAEGMSLAREELLLLPLVDTIEDAALFLEKAGRLAVQQAITRSTQEVARTAAHATAAFISYQAVVWSLGRHIKDNQHVDIPLVGTFTSSLDVISFTASQDLIDMLIANDRISW